MRSAAMATLDSLHWVKDRKAKRSEGLPTATPFRARAQERFRSLVGSLRLLDIGGRRSACPFMTYIATATCVSLAGATPVFVDVEPDHWCIDLAGLEAARTPNTKAVIAVHLYGQMCDTDWSSGAWSTT